MDGLEKGAHARKYKSNTRARSRAAGLPGSRLVCDSHDSKQTLLYNIMLLSGLDMSWVMAIAGRDMMRLTTSVSEAREVGTVGPVLWLIYWLVVTAYK